MSERAKSQPCNLVNIKQLGKQKLKPELYKKTCSMYIQYLYNICGRAEFEFQKHNKQYAHYEPWPGAGRMDGGPFS